MVHLVILVMCIFYSHDLVWSCMVSYGLVWSCMVQYCLVVNQTFLAKWNLQNKAIKRFENFGPSHIGQSQMSSLSRTLKFFYYLCADNKSQTCMASLYQSFDETKNYHLKIKCTDKLLSPGFKLNFLHFCQLLLIYNG